jgi:hypothetical protein
MPIELKKKQAVFVDVASVEEAEPLLAWLQDRKSPTVSLRKCTHMHPANLQVLMAAKVHVSDWPEEATLCAWVQSALTR